MDNGGGTFSYLSPEFVPHDVLSQLLVAPYILFLGFTLPSVFVRSPFPSYLRLALQLHTHGLVRGTANRLPRRFRRRLLSCCTADTFLLYRRA